MNKNKFVFPCRQVFHLEQAGIEIVPFSVRQAVLAATLLPVALPLDLSLGDRACLALALDRKIPALIADTA